MAPSLPLLFCELSVSVKENPDRKKNLMLRLKFARKVRRKLPKGFLTGSVGFYLNGASFTHKMNPFDQARAPRAMV